MRFEKLDEMLGEYAPFLLSLNDSEDNRLTLRIAPSYVGERREVSESEEPNDTIRRLLNCSRPLVSDEERVYEIVFDYYIIYQVGNESFCSGDPRDKFDGKFLRVYNCSYLLENLSRTTDAQILADGSYYPEKWTHYAVVTQNHIVDVISLSEPQVNISNGT